MAHAKSALSNFRIPPDGGGKRLVTNLYYQVNYNNGTHTFIPGDLVEGNSSGVNARVAAVYPSSPTEGVLFLIPEDDVAGTFTPGEIINHNLSGVGNVSGTQVDMHVQGQAVVSNDNPFYGQNVDKDGAAYVRFTEGVQQLDVYGLSRMVQPTFLMTQDFKYGLESERFHTATLTGSTVTHVSNEHAVALDCTTTSGSNASFRSNLRMLTFPGAGTLVTMAVVVGDTGKADVVRRWGLYSNSNGFFFELSGTSLSLVRRSNSTGVTVDTKFAQADWNTDALDGNGPSGMTLDLSKINVFWINFQTMTAGRVRYGVLNEQGERIVCHNETELNTSIFPGTRNLSLPIRIDQFNTNTSASPSRVKMLACDVKIEGVRSIDEDTPPVSRFSSFIMPGTLAITGSGTDWVPAGTFRSAATFNGVDNYLVTVPHIVTAYVSGSPLLIAAVKNATLNTSSFALAGTNTGVEIDASATSISGGRNVSTWMVGPGVSEHHFDTHVWNVRGESMTYRGSGIYGDLYTVAVKKVDPSGSDSTVRLAFNWADVG